MSRSRSPWIAALAGGLASGLRGHGVFLFSVGVAVMVMTFGTVWVWEAARPRVLDTPEYRLNMAEVFINPPPEWITAEDLKQEVFRDASLDQSLSILDERLTERLALAFAAHPWVARVERVEKFYPARVVVSLVYRMPVAAVAEGTELWPIDRLAVLLPREHFSRVQLEKLPRIGGISSGPAVRPGSAWQDSRVQGAALIAEAIGESWHTWGLSEIVPSLRTVRGERNAFTYDLVTHGGRHIAWGRQPIVDDPSEPTPAEKLKRLRSYVEQHGTLDAVSAAENSVPDVPRTARSKQPVDRAR